MSHKVSDIFPVQLNRVSSRTDNIGNFVTKLENIVLICATIVRPKSNIDVYQHKPLIVH